MLVREYTPKEQRALEEKVALLQKIKDGELSMEEAAELITSRILGWLRDNIHLLNKNQPLPLAAYQLLVHRHMKIYRGITMQMIKPTLMRAEAENFCPYLEACNMLDMDTREVCKEIGEPSIVAFMQEINPRLHFSRDYSHIRPHSKYCLEFVEVN